MSKLLPKLILLLLVSFFVLGFAGPGVTTVKAANNGSINFNPNVTIPNSDFKHEDPSSEDAGKPLTKDTKPIADYIKAIYTYAISIVAIAAALALMIGGVVWLTAGGSNTRVENAKKIMTGALSGLVLALGSFFLLAQINPELTKTQWFKIKGVDQPNNTQSNVRGCCEYPEGSNPICGRVTEEDCKNPITWGTGATKGDSTWKGSGYKCMDSGCVVAKKDGERAINGECADGLKFIGDPINRCSSGKIGSPCKTNQDCLLDNKCDTSQNKCVERCTGEGGSCNRGKIEAGEEQPCCGNLYCSKYIGGTCINTSNMSCGDCGNGASNVCDEGECESIPGCTFYDTVGPGGLCQ